MSSNNFLVNVYNSLPTQLAASTLQAAFFSWKENKSHTEIQIPKGKIKNCII